MRASTVSFAGDPANGDRGAIVNYYSNNFTQGGSGADNNGNLLRQENYIPGSSFFQDNFEYDQLNRLKFIAEKLNGTGNDSFKQSFTYDRYGNRRIDTNPSETFGGVNNLWFEVETGTNRLYAPGDLALAEPLRSLRYDAAGNLWKDTYSGAADGQLAIERLYDAENRMTKETQAGGVDAGIYSYDGDGRRVKRKIGTTETWQIYGVGGELIAEYAANDPHTSPQKEYGYRNGELLITASVTSGWGAPPTIDDNPLKNPENPESYKIKALHITQLRDAINALRAHYNLPDYPWQKPNASGGAINNTVLISWEPIDEMRTALNEALGPPSPAYADGLGVNQPILAVHIQELRNRVLEAWVGGGTVDIRWLVADHLGTPRMIFDQTGSLANVSRHDYLPFGEELYAGSGGRTTAQGYTASDNVRQKFTQKERDNETGLDYFLARYYSSAQGRFTGVDPEQEGARNDDPQSWNGYAYARSNPVLYTDPDGKAYLVCDASGKNCQEVSDEDFYSARRTDTKSGFTYTGSRDFYENGQVKDGGGDVLFTYVQISIDDTAKEFIFQMRRRADPIPKATAAFFGISLVLGTTGGSAAYALGPAPAVTTLGLATRAAPAAAGATGVLSQLSRTDASIFQRAAQLGASAQNSFMNNVGILRDALFQVAGPDRQINIIGKVGNSPVYGSIRSRVGIAEVNGVTVVVKMTHGNPKILGPLP